MGVAMLVVIGVASFLLGVLVGQRMEEQKQQEGKR